MHQDSKAHLYHYLVLLLIFLISIIFFNYFRFDHKLQSFIIIATAFSYFIWGIIHHYLEENLYPKVVIEYFLIAFIGSILLISLISQK